MNKKDDFVFIQRAITVAEENIRSGGGPFGAVIVENGEIIAESGNKVRIDNDPTAHAEVLAIRNACSLKQNFSLEQCTIYASCEPCPMCLGAIYWAKIPRLVFASTRQEAASAGFDDAKIYEEMSLPFNRRTIATKHIDLSESKRVFESWNLKEDKKKY